MVRLLKYGIIAKGEKLKKLKSNVYWLKNDKRIVGYENRQMLEDFAKYNDGLILKWEKKPKSCFVIIDIKNEYHDDIIEFLENKFDMKDIKITKRDTVAMAEKKIGGYLHRQSTIPSYQADSKKKMRDVIDGILDEFKIDETRKKIIIGKYVP